ncbi:UDP-N-acetylmuramoyl-L-alanine--D-glutamate ligase [Candidatus Peregrinibacteria bacterium]|nr:UDP-N-acetylmuramoyl-L-alanine--D-glutamate ligase [Candidatus Peregrinibacteria bacterium]
MFLKDVPQLKSAKVTVMGLGLFGGGVGVVEFLAKNGTRVTVTDLKTKKELAKSLSRLKGLPVTYYLGAHIKKDFTDCDFVVVNPAVQLDSPFIRYAIKAGVPLETEMNLFFKLCKGRIIGITGSNGKTTTTALVGEILKRSNKKTWVGGNIGKSLLENTSRIKPSDLVVLELSSFQLDNLGRISRSPNIAVVTNISPNHLDRHKTMRNYIAAKQEILKYQKAGDWACLNADDATVTKYFKPPRGINLLKFSTKKVSVPIFSKGDYIYIMGKRLNVSSRKLLGWFNLENMCAASAAYLAACNGKLAEISALESVFNGFKGVEHRLEFVRSINGVKFYNDSIATNPKSTIEALNALPGDIILIAGGYDKKLSFDELADIIDSRVKMLLLIGQTADKILGLVRQRNGGLPILKCNSMDKAVRNAFINAVPGNTVLLSPACASYDMFTNFTERGKLFKKLVSDI